MAGSSTSRPDRLGPDVPLVDWLVALSHDSPLEQPPDDAARGRAAVPLTAVPALLSLLKDSDRRVRLQATTALGDLGEEVRRVLPALHAVLEEAAWSDPDDAVRTEAARALLRAGPQPTTEVGALADALHSELDIVRFHAAAALGDSRLAGRPAVPELIHACLWDEDPAVRVGAAAALWKIDDNKEPLVLQVLTNALHDASELICWVAVDCLGQMGPAAQQAVPALRRLLQRDLRISLIKKAATLALERITSSAPAEAE
jgi:HEAT repeat protein